MRQPPGALREIYTSFVVDDAMLAMLLEERPPVVSFHFGLPPHGAHRGAPRAGIVLLAAVTSPAEGRVVAAAGVDAVVAQGFEAGGHRGVFDPAAADDRLGTLALTRLLVRELGSRDRRGRHHGWRRGRRGPELGASAAQLGTAFLACPESAADAGFRSALASPLPSTR